MDSTLFSPLDLRGVTARNRVVISPMCQYSAVEGVANDWHLLHLANLARGGAGIVFTEATAVEPRGRITHGDLGIWSDAHGDALKPVVAAIKRFGAVPAIQLAHAGRKASTQRPWQGNSRIDDSDLVRGERPWTVVAPCSEPIQPGWPMPHALTADEIRDLCGAFRAAAARADAVGFEALEIHAAHGYLIHTFLSPLTNHRNDGYGGDLDGRMRFLVEIVAAIRDVWPATKPLFLRISAVDGVEGGWTIDDSVTLARALAPRGVDVVDCSSGGFAGAPTWRLIEQSANLTGGLGSGGLAALPRRAPGFQVPYAARLRRDAGVKTQAVGLITTAELAERIVAEGSADLVAIGREALNDPFWPLHAAQTLGCDPGFALWPEPYGFWLRTRAKTPPVAASDD